MCASRNRVSKKLGKKKNQPKETTTTVRTICLDMRGVATSIVFLAFLVLGIMAQTPFCTADTSGVEAYETLVDSIATPFSLQVLQLPPDNKVQ